MNDKEVWSLVGNGINKDQCWPWLGRLTPQGYGTVWFKKKNHRAHRLLYETLRGEIPTGGADPAPAGSHDAVKAALLRRKP